MQRLIKIFAVFIYLFLGIFIQSNSVFACDNFTKDNQEQYIAAQKQKTDLINNKEEYYIIFQGRNKQEISNFSNRNNNSGFDSFNNHNFNFNITKNFKIENITYPIFISHNISKDLKNTVYTRAP